MKKIFFILTIFLITPLFVLAQNSNQAKLNSNTSLSQNQEQNQERIKAQSEDQLQTIIQNRQQELNQEAINQKKEIKPVYQNQNQVRVAVQALLASEDLVGGIGPQVSEIAQQFNNSVQKTITAEEKIQQRNSFKRFFIGGDDEAAEQIQQEVNLNRLRIHQLEKLKEDCQASEEVKSMLQEQIQNIDQEQNRLETLAQQEKTKKGLWGWLFGWLIN